MKTQSDNQTKTNQAAKNVGDEKTASEIPGYFSARNKQNTKGKLAIAEYIVDNYLTESDSILIDAGSSLYPIAQIIARNANSNPDNTHFTIMTHNYRAFEVLVSGVPREANLNIILAGGRYDQDLNAMFGKQTVDAYKDFFPKVVLIGISGLVAEIGLFCHGNTEELAVKDAIFEKCACDRIIVADYTKIGLLNGFKFGDSQHLHAKVNRCIVVTDEPDDSTLPETREMFARQTEMLRNLRIKVQIVKTKELPSLPQ